MLIALVVDRWQNKTTERSEFSFHWVHDCGASGCLFNLSQDPNEHEDKAAIMPSLAKEMLDQLAQLNRTTFSPYRGPGEQNKDVGAACTAAVDRYGGFFGPFVDV